MLHFFPLLAAALGLIFLAPVGLAAEPRAENDKCIKACDACRDAGKTMAAQ